ncbi:MAG: class I SAM-dependent methyltransferase [Candidatus Diapherotrites archaeon]|nr:class I SAM-dependent methyltransferase [Candidatus Diapherotrites archaeon]
MRGAPFAFEAKVVLGKSAKIFAVDVVKFSHPSLKYRPFNKSLSVNPLLHSITRKPLPFECDAISFSNVSCHMEERQLVNAIKNIWESLRDGGYLISGYDGKMVVLKKIASVPFGWIRIAKETL